ncbi:hypothetical protein C6P45_000911 [Maudiozyma exigua]|uniref:Uncharacterized protein n=1 Tax=Maudiozyma exigua TaxID=34358 RepID=A0A9P6W3U2_MAUEX|nr:hypothetical protein C6P45_000911 [Kazachstania exigua]
MNIDTIVYNVIFPCLRSPGLLLISFQIIPKWIKVLCIVYTITFQFYCRLNNYYKTTGQNKWKSLRDIENSVLVISGGSGRLGTSLIEIILRRFPNVTIINIDTVENKVKSPRIKFYQCDMSNPIAVTDTLHQIKEAYFDQINLIINNAGIRQPFKKLKEITPEEMNKILQINCLSPFEIIKQLSPERGSKRQCYIVTVASVLGVLNPYKVAGYASSKAALISLHQSYEHELRILKVDHVRTLLVLPGQLNTKMFSGFKPPRQFWAPTVDTKILSQDILKCCELGQRGSLNEPFYSYFAHILVSLPYVFQVWIREFSHIDDCLPTEST